MKLTSIALLLVLAASLSFSQANADLEAKPGIETLAFIAGNWHGKLFGGVAEETWLEPQHGTMLGVFRLVWPESAKRLYELFVIEENEAGVVSFVFRHFNAGMELWPAEVDAPKRFTLIESRGERAVFEAADKTQKPARFIFERKDGGSKLDVTVQSLNEDGSVAEEFVANYSRGPELGR